MDNLKCWIVGGCRDDDPTRGLPGTENQCLAVARELGYNITLGQNGQPLDYGLDIKRIMFDQNNNWAFVGKAPDEQPDLIIAGGYKAVPACRELKRQFPKIFVAFLETPCNENDNLEFADLIGSPYRSIRHNNKYLQLLTTPTLITPLSVKSAFDQFANISLDPSHKTVSIVIGGESNQHYFRNQDAQEFAEKIQAWAKKDRLNLLITSSRRTNHFSEESNEDQTTILESWADAEGHYFYDPEAEENRDIDSKEVLLSMYRRSETAIITNCSTSMISDSVTAGLPSYMYSLREKERVERLNNFYGNLMHHNYTRIWDQNRPYAPWKSKSPPNDALKMAHTIVQRMHLNDMYITLTQKRFQETSLMQ